jgi:hypothetical protein
MGIREEVLIGTWMNMIERLDVSMTFMQVMPVYEPLCLYMSRYACI